MADHQADQLLEARLTRVPPQEGLRLGRITQKRLYLGRTEVLGIDLYEHTPRSSVDPLLIHTFALPA